MSRAVPHYVQVVDATGQPARVYGCDSKAEALRDGARIFRMGYVGAVVSVYEGEPGENVDRDPVKVFS